MAYILIFWITVYTGTSPATAEFSSHEACDAALAALHRNSNSVTGICVPKGSAARP